MELSSPQRKLHHRNHHNHPHHHNNHHHDNHHHHHHLSHNPLPSPTSSSSSSSNQTTTTPTTTTNGLPSPTPNPPTVTRSDPSNPYPTTFVQADTSSFKQVVQMLTGSPEPTSTSSLKPKPANPIPPIKPSNKPTRPSTKLYERRNNSLKHLCISPLLPTPAGSSPRHPGKSYTHEVLSPSMLDFPALALSPVTPLIHDPFNRSPVSSNASPNIAVVDKVAEDKAIAEKSFFLHPVSPVSNPEPRLLPLFPVTSPEVVSSSDHHLHHQAAINSRS